MEVSTRLKEKNEIELSIKNVTVAEILRVYLNKQNAEFAAWRREHITGPAILRVQSSGKTVQKEITESITAIKKDLDKISSAIKK